MTTAADKKAAPAFTHKQLCDLAVNWLKRANSRSGPGCQVAFSESKGHWEGEVPDAIGFRAAVYKESSVVVEVKVSRSDFLADKKKPHRIDPAKGMGLYRYFMAPKGIIKPEELPAGWGLIEVSAKGALKVICGHVLLKYKEVDTWAQTRAIEREWTLLVRMLNRVGDVEKAQNHLKEANNRNARLVRDQAMLMERNKVLDRLLFEARQGTASETPLVARRKLREPVALPTPASN